MNQFFNLDAQEEMSALAQMTPEDMAHDFTPGAIVPLELAAEVADWI